jgi:cytoskeletal protein RodZ
MPDQEPQGQGNASELASFGEELRREREIRGISLKEIADATKISKRFLEAIERNDHVTLPAPVFTRGFVREYARYVGLNVEEMVNRYNYAASTDDRIEKPPQVEKYAAVPPRDISPKPPAKRGIPPAYARVNRSFIAILFILAALAGVAWWAVQRRSLSEEEPAVVPVTTAPLPAPALPPKPVVDDSKLRMTVEWVEDSWVELEADGKRVLRDTLAAGERRSFEATDTFLFRKIGNAPGLRITLNDAVVPTLGNGEEVVRDHVFDREALEQLRAAPASGTPESGAAETQTQS